jgi:hypothetical protein
MAMSRQQSTVQGLTLLLLLAISFGHGLGSESSGTKETISDVSNVLAAVITSRWAFFGTVVTAGVSFFASILVFVRSMIANNLKRREIENLADSKLKELAQIRLRDILSKRIEVYPKLWCTAQTMLSDWEREHKEIDGRWAKDLFVSLIAWHKENGIFLSEGAYRLFHGLRLEAENVVRRCEEGQAPTLKDLQVLDRIYSGGPLEVAGVNTNERIGLKYWAETTFTWIDKTTNLVLGLGLAAQLKDDLSSYKPSALSL